MDIDDLSTENLFKIMLELEPEDLRNFCVVSRRTKSICDDTYFRKLYNQIYYLDVEDPFDGLRIAGEVGSLKLFDRFIKKIDDIFLYQKIKGLLLAITAATAKNNYDFIDKLLLNYPLNYFKDYKNQTITPDEFNLRIEEAILEGEGEKNNNFKLPPLPSSEIFLSVNPYYYLIGAIRANNYNNVVKFFESYRDINNLNDNIYLDEVNQYELPDVLIFALPNIIDLVLENLPSLAQYLSYAAINDGNLNLFEKLIDDYNIIIIDITINAAINTGSLDLVKDLLNHLDIIYLNAEDFIRRARRFPDIYYYLISNFSFSALIEIENIIQTGDIYLFTNIINALFSPSSPSFNLIGLYKAIYNLTIKYDRPLLTNILREKAKENNIIL